MGGKSNHHPFKALKERHSINDETITEHCVAPSGLFLLCVCDPGLTPWAIKRLSALISWPFFLNLMFCFVTLSSET